MEMGVLARMMLVSVAKFHKHRQAMFKQFIMEGDRGYGYTFYFQPGTGRFCVLVMFQV